MPVLREDVHCFGDLDCFSLAFGVPGVLMLISIVVFIGGRKLYIVKKPAGNVIVDVTKCVFVRRNIEASSRFCPNLLPFRMQFPRDQSKARKICRIGWITLSPLMESKW